MTDKIVTEGAQVVIVNPVSPLDGETGVILRRFVPGGRLWVVAVDGEEYVIGDRFVEMVECDTVNDPDRYDRRLL